MSGRLSQAERASLGLSAGGLIIDGVRVPVPGVRVTTWVDDPKRAPPITDGRAITKRPIAFVWHTSKGILCRTAAPDAIPSTRAEDLALYQSRATREVSWHLTGDTDGDVIQQADPARWQCWHAGGANAWSLGAELVQRDATGTLTAPQIRASRCGTARGCRASPTRWSSAGPRPSSSARWGTRCRRHLASPSRGPLLRRSPLARRWRSDPARIGPRRHRRALSRARAGRAAPSTPRRGRDALGGAARVAGGRGGQAPRA